jgi:hypothetical protein
MHYRKMRFSTGGNTIQPTNPSTAAIGQRVGPDTQHMDQTTMAYQCISGRRTKVSAWKHDDNYCSDDCQCWEGMGGCDQDSNCQGDLVCQWGSTEDEVCVTEEDRCSVNKPCSLAMEGPTHQHTMTRSNCKNDSFRPATHQQEEHHQPLQVYAPRNPQNIF